MFTRRTQKVSPRHRLRRRPEVLSQLIAALVLFPTVLLGYALLRVTQVASLSVDINRAGALREGSLRAYQELRDQDTDGLRTERTVMAAIRETLKTRYPALVADTNDAWESFSAAADSGTLNAETAEEMRASAGRLTVAIEADHDALVAEVCRVFLLALIAIPAILPICLGLVFRMRRAEASVWVSEALLAEAQEIAQIGSWAFEVATKKISCSAEVYRILEMSPSNGVPSYETVLRRYHPDDIPRHRQVIAQARADGKPFTVDLRAMGGDGGIRWLNITGRATQSEHGVVTRLSGTVQDITERKTQAEKLLANKERFKSAIRAMHDGLVIQNERGEFIIGNQRAEDILGLTSDQLAGRSPIDPKWHAIHEDGTDWPRETHPAAMALKNGRSFTDVLMGIHKADGTLTWLSVNADPMFRDGETRPYGVVVSFHDITEQRRLMEEAIERADRDPLTDLYNHRTFHHRLRVETERVQQDGGSLAVLVMDLDNFKFFNDTYGHLVGDEVLCTVADKLRTVCRNDDILARIGGDEFALLLPRTERDEALECAGRLKRMVHAMTFQPDSADSPIPLRLSVGISLFPEETLSGSEAIYIADKRAMQDKHGDFPGSPSEALRASLRNTTDGFAMLDALVAAVDNKDRYTRHHSEDVMCLSGLIARELGLSDDAVRSLETAALVHDVGKIGVPIRMLRQPGPLSPEEFAAVRQHPTLGGILVASVPELAHTLDAVRYHHEQWNGEGYPSGLRGDEIPLSARILAVADAFSAMTTDRPYRIGMSTEKALANLRLGAGHQWDARCVDAFLACCDRMRPSERDKTLYRREAGKAVPESPARKYAETRT